MGPHSYFSSDYVEARTKFRNAAEEAGASIDSIGHHIAGPNGEALSVDVAKLGRKDASLVLVTLSGTHGVEGFAGSAAQVGFFKSGLHRVLGASVSLLAVHAVNPYGFAYLRRVNEDNVDLNRNFLDHKAGHPSNPGFDELANALCPPDLEPATLQAANSALMRYAEKHGRTELQRAIVSGQYNHPNAIFFGGDRLTWSSQVLARVLRENVAHARSVALIDFHTGLGPQGYGAPMSRHKAGSQSHQRLREWFGDEVTSDSFETHGRISRVFGMAVPGVDFAGINLEFGTEPPEVVLQALRCDNWLHLQAGDVHPLTSQIKEQIREAFYPSLATWRVSIWDRSAEIQERAIRGLSAIGGVMPEMSHV